MVKKIKVKSSVHKIVMQKQCLNNKRPFVRIIGKLRKFIGVAVTSYYCIYWYLRQQMMREVF